MSIAIHWFKEDLRLSDNPAFTHAARQGAVLPIYILDDEAAGADKMGAASRVWLHHSLHALNHELGGNLRLIKGPARAALDALIQTHNPSTLTMTRVYEPWQMRQETEIASWASSLGVDVRRFSGSRLWEPEQSRKNDGTPYRVFTPFYRAMRAHAPLPREPISRPDFRLVQAQGAPMDDLELLPHHPWHQALLDPKEIGERAANARLQHFLEHQLSDYPTLRDYPAKSGTSNLSAALHFGEISPNQAWWAAQGEGAEAFQRELAWREFCYNLMHECPEIRRENWNEKFNHFPWREDESDLQKWQKGQTGIPIVDAGMRELWTTGLMHNRVRMIVASFLTKNLRIHWRHGEAWFWDTLVDADFASNGANWQWVAGSGADAAPYFRIFNPVLQSQKFDAKGQYLRQCLPELAALPEKFIHAPWLASDECLERAGVQLGKTYPFPMSDLKTSRALALEAYRSIS